MLFGGLLAARRWSWWAARGASALGVLWFLAFLAVIPIAPLQSNGVPAPWYGRLYAAGVTLAFAGVFAAAFRALGREETRSYFQTFERGERDLRTALRPAVWGWRLSGIHNSPRSVGR